jgi:cyclic-di-AMP phosphodiesterase
MFNRSLFSSWKDVTLYVTIIFLLLAALSVQQPMFLPAAVLIAIAVFWFARRTLVRKRLSMSGYLDDIIRNIDRANHFAVRNLDVGIAVFSSDGKLQWKNEKFQTIVGKSQLDGKRPEELLPLADNAFETMCVKTTKKSCASRTAGTTCAISASRPSPATGSATAPSTAASWCT